MLLKLLSTIKKEITLLYRDTAGLLVIFVMPVLLVIVVTLVQENVLKSMGETKTEVLFIDRDSIKDRDGESVGSRIRESLQRSGSVRVITELKGKAFDIDTAREAIAKGDFQVCIVVPEGITEAFRKKARQRVKGAFLTGDKKKRPIDGPEVPELLIYFDPALREAFRTGMISSLEKMLLGMEAEEKAEILFEQLPGQFESAVKKAMGSLWSEEFAKAVPRIRSDWDNMPIMAVKEKIAQYGDAINTPNTVQQNVPAWTLFGMFFIVVPLGASLIRERQEGLLVRLLTMPLSYLTIISGKITAYVIICVVQFALIMAVGTFVLPLLGTPVLDIGTSPAALVLIAVSSALAASGYGILLGTVARTYEQASAFGAVSVVIAAALGGIMVPAYVMPKIMQSIGAFSPLSWGLNAFLTIFVRGGGVRSILSEVSLMLLFFIFTTLTAWFYMFRRGRIRIH